MTHVNTPFPFNSAFVNDASAVIARRVFSPHYTRPFDPRAGSNVTIAIDAEGAIVASTGGAATPDDADLTIAQQAYHSHAPQIPTVRAGDASITVLQDALGYILTAATSGAVDDESNVIAQKAYQVHAVTITETTILMGDNTVNDVSTAQHGFAPKGIGDSTKFLNSNGTYSVPSGTGAATDFLIVQVFS